jgi:hypothetical protein
LKHALYTASRIRYRRLLTGSSFDQWPLAETSGDRHSMTRDTRTTDDLFNYDIDQQFTDLEADLSK